MDGTVISDTVNVASRVEHLTKKFGAAVLMTGALREQITDLDRFAHRYLGKLPIRGKSVTLEIYEILDGQSQYILDLHAETQVDFKAGISAFWLKDYRGAQDAFNAVLVKNPADEVARFYQERLVSFVS